MDTLLNMESQGDLPRRSGKVCPTWCLYRVLWDEVTLEEKELRNLPMKSMKHLLGRLEKYIQKMKIARSSVASG